MARTTATTARRSPMKGKKRPITTAMNIVARMEYFGPRRTLSVRSHARLLRILKAVNAASGTTDERTARRRAHTIGAKK